MFVCGNNALSIALGGLLSLGVVTHPAIGYSRVTEGCYLEENELEKKEKAMLSLSQPPFIRDRLQFI